MTPQDSTPTALVALVLRSLTSGKAGEERYLLNAPSIEALNKRLAAVIAAKSDTKRSLEDLLQLAEVLERNGAPAATMSILQVVAASEVARAVLGAGTTRAKVATAEFARFKGEVKVERAPVHGSRAPSGSLKASSFLEPGRERRVEASRAPVKQAPKSVALSKAAQPAGMRLR